MRFMARVALAGALFAAAGAAAQGYPNRPVRVLVGFPAGGANDIVTRVVGQKLGEIWNQQVLVDNRGGAGGNIAGELAAKAAPDGYTLFMTSGSIVTANQHIYAKMPFDPAKDLAPVTVVARGPQALVVTPTFPPKTVREFIALARARPHEITFGSAGIGTQTHLAAENFIYSARIDVVHVPYKGEAPALTDVMGGQVQFATPNIAAAIAFIQQGKLRALGVTSLRRSPQLPDVPAIAETLAGFENLGWFALMAPSGTPRETIERIQRDTVKALANAEVKARFETLGMETVGNPTAEFAKALGEESERWAKIVRERKLRIE